MCDTLCAVGGGRTLFGKNSDRPVAEAQVGEVHGRRVAGGRLRTQYLEIDDAGAYALFGSRPTWLWGLEHGVNEHGIAIGNEKVWTVDDPHGAEPALIGMDLVRLGLERSATADDALDVMTALLDAHGQGGSGEEDPPDPYWSSFLVADARRAWVLETSGRTWAARPVEDGAAISNRITLGTDWTRASGDVPAGADFDRWRNPRTPTGIADHRLGATRQCVATGGAALTAADVVATLRHHGERPWGAPGSDPADVSLPPTEVHDDWRGVTVCMHVRDYQATTASLVAELPVDDGAPLRAWIALGSPCVSVYVPAFPPVAVAPELSDPASWSRFAALRDRVERDGSELGAVRAVLAPIEAELWAEADESSADPVRGARFAAGAWRRVDAGLAELGV
ncbi:MAG TPA: peptidase family C69 [Acidimicrobiia bacterium]|nr:peptidase family C69 [Acidimicrobiia bacterium]